MSEHLERLLVGAWEWGQRMGVRHRRALDVGVALAIALFSFGGLWVQHRLHHADVVVFCVLLPAPLLLRRRSPSLAFGLVAAVCLVQWVISTPQLANGALLVALYWVALEEDLAHGAIAAAVTEGGAIMAAARWSPGDPLRAWAGLSGLTVAATVLGVVVRQRRALVASLHERAAQLELERDREHTARERERGSLERMRGVRRRARDDGDRERRRQRDNICRHAERDEHARPEARNREQRDKDDGAVAGELADKRTDRDAHGREQHDADPAAIWRPRIGESDQQRSSRDSHRLDQIAGRGADEQREADTKREPLTPLQLHPFALEADRASEDAPRCPHGARRR